jgi:tRNA A-37 threonylcarbamoyl transferase component Bud32
MADDQVRFNSELGDEQRLVVHRAVERFEALWRSSPFPELSELVPDRTDPLRLRILVELITVDQELRWDAGKKTLLESYLERWPELQQELELKSELLEAECRSRGYLGDLPSWEELKKRFPDIDGRIDLSRIAERLEKDVTPTPGLFPLVLKTGAPFGRYEIRDVLGSGGTGTVYRAFDTRLERDVALKVWHVAESNGTRVRKRFLREARTVAAINHAHVCPIYDVGDIDGTPFFTMRLIEGESLAACITNRGQTISHQLAAILTSKLAQGLSALHDAGIVHRDVKPGNIMLDAQTEPVLMDFGLARKVDDAAHVTATGDFSVTPAYMSPEQAARKFIDHRSDIFSLGAVFYELLTNERAFPGDQWTVGKQIIEDDPRPPRKHVSGVPRDIETICLKCLEKDPDARYSTCLHLHEDLERVLRGEPIHARPVGIARRLSKWVRRRPAVAALLLAVAILTTAVLAQLTQAKFLWRAANMIERISVALGVTEAKLLFDDFEGYDVLDWPAAWIPAWNAQDLSNNGVYKDPGNSTSGLVRLFWNDNQVLKLFGTENYSASALRRLDFPTNFVLSARVYNYHSSLQERRAGWGRGSISLKDVTALFTFYSDGHFKGGNLECLYEPNRWYDVRVECRRIGNKLTSHIWLDGHDLGKTQESIPDLASKLEKSRLELNGGSSAYFDDIEVKALRD